MHDYACIMLVQKVQNCLDPPKFQPNCAYGFIYPVQGVKVGTLGRQNERNSSYIWFVFYVSMPNKIKLLLFNIFFFDWLEKLAPTYGLLCVGWP